MVQRAGFEGMVRAAAMVASPEISLVIFLFSLNIVSVRLKLE
jgi:hypothetical protein